MAPRGRPPAPCGTITAYRRHNRLGQAIDTTCQAAHDAGWPDATGPARPAEPKPHEPVIVCPTCELPTGIDYPFDTVARRFARMRHLRAFPACVR